MLGRASQGGEFTITKHDRPLARLVGYQQDRAAQRAKAAAAIRAGRQAYTLGGLDVRALR